MYAQDIINFWFDEQTKPLWFAKNQKFDDYITENFKQIHQQATQSELYTWRTSAEGRLAEVIILDQFSRQLFRNSRQAFAYDGMALILAQEAIQLKLDQNLETEKRRFLYMPFMHSESQKIHEQAVPLFQSLNEPNVLKYEMRHKVIIDRFGRYPHRNQVLGRKSSAEELIFLTEPNSRF